MEIIQTQKDETLLSKSYFTALARRLKQMEKSRREVPNSLATELFNFAAKGGVIKDGEGKVIALLDDIIERAFGQEGTFKWISDCIGFANRPRQRRSKHTLLLRLQLFDVYFQILSDPIDVKDGEDLYNV